MGRDRRNVKKISDKQGNKGLLEYKEITMNGITVIKIVTTHKKRNDDHSPLYQEEE